MRFTIIVSIATLWLGFTAIADAANITPANLEGTIDADATKASGTTAPRSRSERLAAGEDVYADTPPAHNLIGPTSEEEHGQRRTKVASMPLGEQMIRGFRSTFVYSGWCWVNRHWIETDSNFNLDDHFESLKQGIPGEYWKRFGGVRSLREANHVRGEIMQELSDQNIVTHSQGAGYAAYILGKLFVDLAIPVLLLAIWLSKRRNSLRIR